MQAVILYARRLQAGETPADPLPGNLVPVNVTADGKLQVDVASVEITLPGGGVNILDPIGASGGVKVESISGVPLQVEFVSAPDVNITGPLSPGGGVKVAPTAGEPLNVQFPAAQNVQFASPQEVTFPAAQDVQFPSPQEVIFPAAQSVAITSPVGAGGGVRVENNPGAKLAVDYGGAIPEVTMAPGLTDPFSRLRVSDAQTLFDSRLIYDSQPEHWGQIVAGGGTAVHVANQSEVRLTVGSASGDRAVRQSYKYVPYQPGKGRLAFLTGLMANEPKANCTARIGLFDKGADKTVGVLGGDGVFFELVGTTMFCVIRSFYGGATTEERAAQSTWNVDKMDGTGPSGLTMNWAKAQIFVIDLEWLGVGTVTFGLVYNRRLYVVHQFHHANLITGVYMRRADLPVRYELENTGATSGTTFMSQICSTVISEGGYQPSGDMHTANLGNSVKSISTLEVPVLAIRLAQTYCRSSLSLLDVQFEVMTSDTVFIRIYTGLITLTGAAWTNVDAVNSIAQFDRSANAFGGSPILRYSGYVTVNTRKFAIPMSAIPLSPITDIAGNPYPILITGQNFSGPADVVCSATWDEV